MMERAFALLGVLILLGAGVGAVAPGIGEAEEQNLWSPEIPELSAEYAETGTGEATLGNQTFETVQEAVDAATPGDTIYLEGGFSESVVIDTPNLTVKPSDTAEILPRIHGQQEGTVVTIDTDNVTIIDVAVTGSGPDRSSEDAGLNVNGTAATISNLTISDVTYGIWVNGAHDVDIIGNTIIGDPEIPVSDRGNGIHLWEADGAVVEGNQIQTLRDGIYYQWSSHVVATNNTMWDLRYGVHYMYSDHNRLEGNLAFQNDVGFALMVSENLTIVDNRAVENRDGPSEHGILVKDIDDSVIRGNDLVDNGYGLYVYNAHGNEISDNLILENRIGLQHTAGSSGSSIVGNSLIHNDRPAYATHTDRISFWNGTERGNYWSDARVVDLDGDGTSDVRHQPAGTVETLLDRQPSLNAFAESPAFDAIRLAESSFPVIGDRGVVDRSPLMESPHDHWREYYEN